MHASITRTLVVKRKKWSMDLSPTLLFDNDRTGISHKSKAYVTWFQIPSYIRNDIVANAKVCGKVKILKHGLIRS